MHLTAWNSKVTDAWIIFHRKAFPWKNAQMPEIES